LNAPQCTSFDDFSFFSKINTAEAAAAHPSSRSPFLVLKITKRAPRKKRNEKKTRR